MSDVITRVHYDASERTVTFERVQDVEAILEHNKRLQSMPQKSDWGRHIATIPNVILEKWMKEDGVNLLGLSSEEWGAFIRKKLADPDYRFLRTDK
jgi:hypothetical protein